VAGVLLLLGVLFFFVLTFGVMSLKVIQQFEKGIVFRLGRIQLSNVREPGLTAIVPFLDRIQKVNMQVVTMGVPAQEGITRDNISVRVDAVVYFRVIDPIKAIVNVQNYYYAVSQVAQTSLRSVIGQVEMDQLLSDREAINRELRTIIDEITEGPWGVLIDRVEIKDVSLPEGMKRSMARQAEAERERRARIISADGEFQASKRLAAAAHEMSRDPASLQLRLLQTVVEVAAEKNSTLVMPLPVEMLRFFDRAAGSAAAALAGDPAAEDGAPSGDASVEPPPEPAAIAATDDVPDVQELPKVAAASELADVPDIPDVTDLPEDAVADAPAAPPATGPAPGGPPPGAGPAPAAPDGRPAPPPVPGVPPAPPGAQGTPPGAPPAFGPPRYGTSPTDGPPPA
jgi:regulator of protease activity HflC (stomatin/prohibitin superfamily)